LAFQKAKTLKKNEAILGTVANLINERGNQLFETQLNDFLFSWSPKSSRRDEKPETERVTIDSNLDQKNRRRLQDALPLETLSGSDFAKVESGSLSKETDKKPNEHGEGSKHSSKPIEVPWSWPFFQVFSFWSNCWYVVLWNLFWCLIVII